MKYIATIIRLLGAVASLFLLHLVWLSNKECRITYQEIHKVYKGHYDSTKNTPMQIRSGYFK